MKVDPNVPASAGRDTDDRWSLTPLGAPGPTDGLGRPDAHTEHGSADLLRCAHCVSDLDGPVVNMPAAPSGRAKQIL